MDTPINHQMIVDFILNDVSDEQREMIVKTINNDEITRGMYMFEKRKQDVERYLDNEMNVGEQYEFEELLKNSPSLNEHFVFSKEINTTLKVEMFKNRLNKIHNKLFATDNIESVQLHREVDNYKYKEVRKESGSGKNVPPVKKLNLKIHKVGKWVAAASIILLVSISTTKYISNQETLENKLYNKYYEPHNDKDFSLIESSLLFEEAKNKYYNREYSVALKLLENLPNSMTIEGEKLLYQGLALMELKRYEEAIFSFNQLNSNTDFKFIKPFAKWYLGLCHLKIGNKTTAVEYFSTIDKNNGYNCEKARKILKKLN